MKIIILILIISFLILKWKYKNFNNPYKLYLIFGKKGSGKSSYLSKLAVYYHNRKYNVYTNMDDLTLDYVRHINPELLGRFIPEPHSVLLLDECGILYDNRKYKSFSDETRDFYKLQRHYKCIVYLASQSFDVDKKLRDLVDQMFLVTAPFNFLSVIRPISKKITLVEATSMGESKIADNLQFKPIFCWKFMFIPRYAKYFSSFIAPVKPYIEYK